MLALLCIIVFYQATHRNKWIPFRERLKSRRPFVPAARKLLQDLTELDIRAAQWTDLKWSTEYSECSSDLRAFIPRTSTRLMGRACPDHHGSGTTACGLVLGVFSRSYTNGALLLHRIANVALPNKSQNTSFRHAPYIGHLQEYVDRRFWMSTHDAG